MMKSFPFCFVLALVSAFALVSVQALATSPAPFKTPWPTEVDPSWNCGLAGGQIAMNRCFRERNEAAEVELEAAYAAFVTHFIPPDEEIEPPIVEEQQEAQAAFVRYRDLHCNTLVASQGGGSATDMVLFRCLAELNEMRAQQLKDLIGLY